MQQPQSNNRQNSSIERTIEAPTQTLKSLLSNQKSHGYSKPKQPYHYKRANPHAKSSFKPTYGTHENKGQQFKNNRKYQKQTAHTIQLKIMQPNIKPCIWIWVKLEQEFLLENQYPYFLLDSFNSQWMDNGNLTLAFDHGLWFWKLVICDLFELFSYPIVWHIQSYLFWIRFKLFVWKFQYA